MGTSLTLSGLRSVDDTNAACPEASSQMKWYSGAAEDTWIAGDVMYSCTASPPPPPYSPHTVPNDDSWHIVLITVLPLIVIAVILLVFCWKKQRRKGTEWDFFISHTQRDPVATTMASDLYLTFHNMDKTCWLDVKMEARARLAIRVPHPAPDRVRAGLVARRSGTRRLWKRA